MGLRNDQTVVASTVRGIKKALVNGRLDSETMYNIFMFDLLDYYIDFTQCTIDEGFEGYKDINRQLTESIRKFTYCHDDDICNYPLDGGSKGLDDFLASNATITIDTIDIQISQLQI